MTPILSRIQNREFYMWTDGLRVVPDERRATPAEEQTIAYVRAQGFALYRADGFLYLTAKGREELTK